jgi:hypothetical protein
MRPFLSLQPRSLPLRRLWAARKTQIIRPDTGGTALSEQDFVKDSSLFTIPESGVVAIFLENPNSTLASNN